MATAPSKSSRLARWFGLQLAAKAVGLALGTPLVAGAAMAVIAFVRGLPLEWAFPAVIVSAAGASALLNQARTFMLAYSVANKVYDHAIGAQLAANDEHPSGYSIFIRFLNAADVPLEYRVTRVSAHLEGRLAKQQVVSTGSLIEAGEERPYMIGLVPMDPVQAGKIKGEVEVEYVYGRPGKLNHVTAHRRQLMIATDENGQVASCNVFNLA
jgi:hypothetical protein